MAMTAPRRDEKIAVQLVLAFPQVSPADDDSADHGHEDGKIKEGGDPLPEDKGGGDGHKDGVGGYEDHRAGHGGVLEGGDPESEMKAEEEARGQGGKDLPAAEPPGLPDGLRQGEEEEDQGGQGQAVGRDDQRRGVAEPDEDGGQGHGGQADGQNNGRPDMG